MPGGSADGTVAAAASSPQDSDDSGAPLTPIRPSKRRTSFSLASSRWAARRRALPSRATAAPNTAEQRVRVPDRDGVERDSQGVGHDLRPRGLVSLPLRAGPGQDREGPLVVGLHRRELASPARDLNVAADTDAELPRFPAADAGGLLLAQLPVSGRAKGDI